MNYWICGNVPVDGNVKGRNYCHITQKYRGFAHRDCNFKVKLNDNISIVLFTTLRIRIHILLCKNQANSILK